MLFSSLLRLGWEEELCSGGVVGGGGRTSAVETLTSRPILPGLAPSGSTPAAGRRGRSKRKKPQARMLRQGLPEPYRLFIG